MGFLVLTEGGGRLTCEGERLRVLREGRLVQETRFQDLDCVVTFGSTGVTGAAVRRLLGRGIEVVFLDGRGGLLGRLSGPASRNVALRVAQLRGSEDETLALGLARRLVAAKLLNQRWLLLRYRRRRGTEVVGEAAGKLRILAGEAMECDDRERLLGLEGAGSRVYFAVLGALITNPLFDFSGRNRRPPRDPVNAALSFGYTVVGSIVEGEAAGVGLDPAVGFLHRPEYGRPSLALDLLEPIRPVAVDAVVLRLVNKRQLTPGDFAAPSVALGRGANDIATDPWLAEPEPDRKGGVYLSRTGRPVLLRALVERLRQTMLDPEAGRASSLRETVRRQSRGLAVAVQKGRADLFTPFRAVE